MTRLYFRYVQQQETKHMSKMNKSILKKQLSNLGIKIIKGNYINRKDAETVLSEYNGWANYETWNVDLWISNDEGSYKSARRQQPFDASSAEEFVKELYPEGTPDFEDMGKAKCYDEVNWEEVAESFNEY